MDVRQMYESKLVSAQEAVGVVKSGDWIDWGWCATAPVALDEALAKRLPELTDINFRGSVLMYVPEIYKIENPAQHFTWNSCHMSGIERKAIEKGFAYYLPIRYSELPRYYRESTCKPDVAMFQVCPMDEFGYFNFGTSVSHAMDVCENSTKVILEVNEKMPYCYGGTRESIHISQVDMVVQGPNKPLAQLPVAKPSDLDNEVAKLIVDEIPNGACLQLGIGGMPNAVGKLIAQSDLKDLGVHTEMYVDAFVALSKAGKITGEHKNLDWGRQTYAFALGSQELYEFLDHNPRMMAAPVEYVNDVRTIASLDDFISINSAVEVDIYGQVNAESSGMKQISGAGGQLDFVLGAYLSKGGKSFVCCPSTHKDKQGNLHSTIVPFLKEGSIVTDTRANAHIIVTEYGKANLKGLSSWQRSEALIQIAHPKFREELIQNAEKQGVWRRSNKR